MTAENVAPPPRDNLTRAMAGGYDMVEGDGKTLVGQIARPGEWAEIDSRTEGHFMEMNAPGAFAKTFAENAHLRFLFQHGKDPELGTRPIAVPQELREDGSYRAELLDGLPALILDGLRKRQYGSSHTFSVIREDWNPSPRASTHNPEGIPERTIKEARVHEISVVTWPAYASATVGLRSMTDERLLDTLTEPPAPSVDAGAPPHLEPERREEPAVQPTPAPKEIRTVEYITRDEKAARARDLERTIAERAVAFPGVFPADVQSVDDAENKERDDLVRDIAAWDFRQERLKAFANQTTGNGGHTVPGEYTPPNIVKRQSESDIYDLSVFTSRLTPEERNQRLRDDAMRAVEQARFGPQADSQKTRDRVGFLLDNKDTKDKELARMMRVTGSPGYRAAFMEYLNTGRSDQLQRYAPLTTGTAGTGGYATPWVLDPSFIHVGAWTSVNPFRQACRVVDLVGTNKWEALTITAVLAAYAGEAVAVAEGGPATVGQPTYNCLKAHAFVTLSYELLEDRPDMGGEITQLIQEAKDTLEENYFSVGGGTTVPWGVALLAEYTTKKTHGAGAVDIQDIYNMEMDLPIRYRANAAWFMSRATIRAVQGFETVGGILFNSTLGYPAVGNPVMNRVGNTGLQLLGYPVYEAPSISSTLTTPDTNPITFCDPSSYIIVDRVGLNVEVVQNIFEDAAGTRPTGQRGIYAHWRNTARRVNVDAGRILVVE